MSFEAGSVFAILGAKFNASAFAAYEARLAATASKTEAAERRMVSSHGRSSKAAELLGVAAKGAATGGIAALAGATVYAVKHAADFEQQLSLLGSATNKTGSGLDALRKQAMAAGAATKYSALDAAKAQTELAKGGMTAAQILGGGLKGALALAAAGNLDLSQAASVTVNSLNNFQMAAGQAGHVADALAKAANITTADVGDFGVALTEAGGVAHAAGIGFDSTVTALEALAKVGIKGSLAGGSLKSALNAILTPSKQQTAAAKEAGFAVNAQGQAFVDATGKLKPFAEISAELRDKLGGMTQAQRTATEAVIAGSYGQSTLNALYQAGPTNLNKYKDGLNATGYAAKVAAQNQDNLKGKLENLQGSVETLGIAVGSKLLPALSNLATSATNELNKIDGQKVGDSIISGFDAAGHAASDFISVARPVVGTLLDIGQALHLNDVGNIESILAGIAGFKIATTVLPGILAFSGALKTLYLEARTAPSLAAMFSGLSGGPILAAGVAIGALTAYLVHSATAESQDEAATRANAAAKRDLQSAVAALHGGEQSAVDARNAAVASTDRVRAAEQRLADLRADPKSNPREITAAEHDRTQALTDSTKAHADYANALQKQNGLENDALTKANDRLRTAKDNVARLKDQSDALGHEASGFTSGSAKAEAYGNSLKKLGAAQRELTNAQREFGLANRTTANAELDKQRISEGAGAILQKNAAAYQYLNGVLSSAPKEVRARYLLTGTQSAANQLATLTAALDSVGKKETVVKVLAKADSATEAIRALQALVAGVPSGKVVKILGTTKGKDTIDALTDAIKRVPVSKNPRVAGTAVGQGAIDALAGAMRGVPGSFSRTVTLTTIHEERFKKIYEGIYGKRAAGRGAIGAETALVGEGAVPREYVVDPKDGTVSRVDQPTVMNLSPTSYVVPTDPRFRGRAMGFMQDIAKDMGLSGFAAGRPPIHRWGQGGAHAASAMPVPDRYEAGAVDESALQDQVRKEREALQKREKSIKDDEKKKKTLGDKIDDLKKKASAKGLKGKAKKAAEDRLASARGDFKELADEIETLKGGGGKSKLQSVATMRQAWKDDQANLRKLQATNREIERLNTIQETDRQKMDNASKRKDAVGYNAAKADRDTTLATLAAKLKLAVSLAKPGSKIAADLDQKLEGIKAAQLDSPAFEDAANEETEADRMQQTGFTDAEAAALQKIQADEALAALTEGTGDDTDALNREDALLSSVLGEIQADPAHRGGNATIADVAGQLKSVRDSVKGFVDTNTNDVKQAQLDQANAALKTANANAATLQAAVTAFGGPGDIGSGGYGNAYQAGSGININVTALHPGDPSVYDAIGRATTRAFDLQGGVTPARQPVGV